jgi:hypothetical protein
LRIRQELLTLYGNACRCCGEAEPRFLTLDHVFNDGRIERQSLLNSEQLYEKVVKAKVPDPRYQLLCWNCNLGKFRIGTCPHQAARQARGPKPSGVSGRRPSAAA